MQETTSNSFRRDEEGDDDDYMSMPLEDYTSMRPGIVSRNTARLLKLEQRHVEANKSSKQLSRSELEHSTRESGLDKALTEENKGFALLSKMGYKPGMVIGKQSGGAAGAASKEPIRPEVKTDRKGLGHKIEQKRKVEELASMRKEIAVKRQKYQEVLVGDYKSRVREMARFKSLKNDLFLCQKACKELDDRSGVEQAGVAWFWPASYADNKIEEQDDDDDLVEDISDIESQLISLAKYLRDNYHYCNWCGSQFDDDADLEQNCPGIGREAHDD